MQPIHNAVASNYRIEINAGKCIYDGNMLKPDRRRGKLILYKAYDSLLHVQWICRENNRIEEDLIVIDDAYLQKIEACKTGRVYVMKFIYSGKTLFFWMQDADESKDMIFVNEFNRATGYAPSSLKTKKKYETNINIAELSNSLVSKLKSIQQKKQKKGVVFSNFIRTEYFDKLLEIPEVCDELKKHMPEGYQTKEDILYAVKNKMLDGSLKFLDTSLTTRFNFVLNSLNIPLPEKEVNDPMEYIVQNLEKKYEDPPQD